MAENRDEILADFQACTGIEDVDEAIFHLEESNWNLLNAVSRVMPPDSQVFEHNKEPDVMVVDDYINVPSSPTETSTDDNDKKLVSGGPSGNGSQIKTHENHATTSLPSTSSSFHKLEQLQQQPQSQQQPQQQPKMLKFNIQYCDKIIPVEMPDSATVSDLKHHLLRELRIPPCRQLLSGWARMCQYENTPFSKLQLPKENALHLTVKANEGGFTADTDGEVTERLTGMYKLNIKYEGTTYNLKYQGMTTIRKVKEDVYSLTNIHVRNQIWSGWPPNIDNDTMLALSGISYPEHDLVLKVKNDVQNKEKKPIVVQLDSEDDEFEDASEGFTVDDDYFIDNMVTKRPEPLIPDNVEDEVVGSITFSENFTARYGPIHPCFYQGTLEDAIKEACAKPAADRKILAIYLHHDASVLTNVFCTQLLGFESVMQMFENNFILWGWDITYESNRAKLQQSVQYGLGATAAASLQSIQVDRLPALILIMKIRSSTDIFTIIHGNVGVNELLSSLIEAVEVFTEHQRLEMIEEQERAERELVKWEQDEAYRESLAADRAKEEAKRAQAEADLERQRKLENEKAQELARKEAHRKKVEATLPPEPPLNHSDTISKIRFRLPKGENIERRFTINTPLKILLDFLTSKGFPSEEYKVISSWPRRDLTSLDKDQTLKQLKLYPQETVILEER